MPGERWDYASKYIGWRREIVGYKWFKSIIRSKQKVIGRKNKRNGVKDKTVDYLIEQWERGKIENLGKMDNNFQYSCKIPFLNC